MDDFSITDERLTKALADLRWINRVLGVYRSSDTVLRPLLETRNRLEVLDLGCGGGDYLCHLVRRGNHVGCRVRVVGLDANPATVKYARAYLDRELSSPLRSQVRVDVGDALDMPYERGAFDVVHAAHFLHHFHGRNAVRLLESMQGISRLGLLVNDLHRHLGAYLGILLLSRLLGMSSMVQHDGPLSVRRGFRRRELEDLARNAGLPPWSIHWHWAFRWTLSTLPG